MFKLQKCLLALLASTSTAYAYGDKCKPMQVAIEYAGFRAKVEELPIEGNKHSAYLKSTLESFESKMLDAESDSEKNYLFTTTFDTVDLIMDGRLFDHSMIKKKYQVLNQRMDECKGPEVDDDLQNLLTINVSEQGKKRIEKEVHDVKLLWQQEFKQNNQRLVNIWFRLLKYQDSKRGKKLIKKGKDIAYTEKAQHIRQEVQDVLKDLKQEVNVHDHSLEIDNDKLKQIAVKVEKINKDYEDLKRSKEFTDFKDKLREEKQNPQILELEMKADKFLKTKYGKQIKKEVQDVELALNEEFKVSDFPWDVQMPHFRGIDLIE